MQNQSADGVEFTGAVPGDVFFDYDEASLREPGLERLGEWVEFLTRNGELRVTLEGHCDERGDEEYNLALGQKRADAVQKYLTSRGVSERRLETISYGEERPFCTESTEACWQRNRRVHIVPR